MRAAIERSVPHGRSDHGRENDVGAWQNVPECVAARWNELEPGFTRIAHNHPRVAKSARQLFNMSENERSGVISTANTYLARFAEPIMGQDTSACDWRIGDLVSAAKPVSLYLVVRRSGLMRRCDC